MKIFTSPKLLQATAVCMAFAGSANAAALDAQAIMNGFVSISLGDFTASVTDHIEGPAYIGGSFTNGTFYVNDDAMPDVDLDGVVGSFFVGGDLTTDFNSTQTGAVQVGGTFSGNTNGETVNSGVTGIPVAEMTSLFETLSTTLSSTADTTGASVSGDFNNATFTSGAGDADGIAYLTLTDTDVANFLTSQANLTFNMAAGVSLIINVPGDFESGVSELTAKVNTDSPYVLFNFFEATELTFGSNPFNASVLAPFADVHSAGGGTNGTVVGATIDLGGEIRPFNNTDGYMGDLPSLASAPAPVPLPAGILLLGGALAGLGLTRRIKSRA